MPSSVPWLIGFAAFTAVPFVISIYLSFTRYNVVTDPVWVGAVNYRTLLAHDPLFWKALGITLKYAAIAVPLGIFTGVALALLLNLEIRGIAIYRTIFYLPSIVPVVATSVVFLWILNPQIGLGKRTAAIDQHHRTQLAGIRRLGIHLAGADGALGRRRQHGSSIWPA